MQPFLLEYAIFCLYNLMWDVWEQLQEVESKITRYKYFRQQKHGITFGNLW